MDRISRTLLLIAFLPYGASSALAAHVSRPGVARALSALASSKTAPQPVALGAQRLLALSQTKPAEFSRVTGLLVQGLDEDLAASSQTLAGVISQRQKDSEGILARHAKNINDPVNLKDDAQNAESLLVNAYPILDARALEAILPDLQAKADEAARKAKAIASQLDWERKAEPLEEAPTAGLPQGLVPAEHALLNPKARLTRIQRAIHQITVVILQDTYLYDAENNQVIAMAKAVQNLAPTVVRNVSAGVQPDYDHFVYQEALKLVSRYIAQVKKHRALDESNRRLRVQRLSVLRDRLSLVYGDSL